MLSLDLIATFTCENCKKDASTLPDSITVGSDGQEETVQPALGMSVDLKATHDGHHESRKVVYLCPHCSVRVLTVKLEMWRAVGESEVDISSNLRYKVHIRGTRPWNFNA